MQIVFVSNFINHHQVPVADILYSTHGIDYKFVATMPIPEWIKQSGYLDFSNRPYYITAYQNDQSMQQAKELINNADVVIIGAAPKEMVSGRIKNNKVTFHYSERWFRTGFQHILDPRVFTHLYKHHIRFRHKRSYLLCASAFLAPEARRVFAYPHKCFKWGYFTETPSLDVEKILTNQREKSKTRILYISRFLPLKHPELPVKMARRLKDSGIDFELNMYGNGPEYENIKRLIDELDVADCVNLCGNKPNREILEIMRRHHIFLLTSDRNEGWGAVVNEAMSNCCAVVAGEKIGSVPFLIEPYKNGLIFKDRNLDSLVEKTLYMINNPAEREEMVRNAYATMRDVWSPENAVKSLLRLAESALRGDLDAPECGPCSPA